MTAAAHRPTTPLFRRDLVRWQHLVVPQWLALLQAGAPVEAAPEGAWCVLEVGSDGGAAYAQGHVPGARYVDTHWLEAPPLWNKVSDDALLAVLLGLGIAHDTTVIVLGRTATAVGRVAHLMLYAGVRDVRLLDGGVAAWQRAGLPWAQGKGHLPSRVQAPCPPAGFGVPCPAQPQWMLNLAQAEQYPHTPGAALVSVRTWGEHTGRTSGYDYISAKGDIPGALWGHADSAERHALARVDVNGMDAFHTADGCLRSAADIAAMWRAEGIHPGLQLAFYCGTGWRASLAFFYAWLMGWEHIAVFDGGWLEWSVALAPSNTPAN
ncbi:sulfurtransferase [Rhodoferax aquaticus]|uniref:Sulfurtransferase n=1 Tax=Rhodoferax aquaticus TaxID=2527691 RepID=A0A515EL15_9BURK|nr:rhodanese-like domain-containing protein [Rhodoferax aquaticus]QDL53309.1 sulfurtransferase [Rhodoferax aquaticus]